MDSFVLVAYLSLVALRTLLQQFTSLPELYFKLRRFILLVHRKRLYLQTMAAAQAAENHGDD